MAKAKKFIRGLGSSSVLHDSTQEGRLLAQTLLAKTKHGRQVRMLRLVCKTQPTIPEMQKTTKMSRRTIFRYLNSLEEYGVRFNIGDSYRYEAERLPKCLKRLL